MKDPVGKKEKVKLNKSVRGGGFITTINHPNVRTSVYCFEQYDSQGFRIVRNK
jgi:hypothetical protein